MKDREVRTPRTRKTRVLRPDQIAYHIRDAAELIGSNLTAAYVAINNGELLSYKEGKRRMVTRRALEDYAERKERQAQARTQKAGRRRAGRAL